MILAACSPRPVVPLAQAAETPVAARPATASPPEVVGSCAEPKLAPAAGRENAIDLFLADRPADAEAALQKVLAASPRDRAAALFLTASKKKLATTQTQNGDAFLSARRVKLAPIALAATVIRPAAETGAKVTLEKTSETKNLVTDTADWEAKTGTTAPRSTEPGAFPPRLGRERLRATLRHPDHVVALYGHTVIVTAEGKQPLSFDASAALGSGPHGFEIGFAQLVGRTLIVQFAHNGYARASGGKNGYIAAFDSATGALVWTSAPLVSNSDETIVSGGSIVTGYGFTAEPDHLFVLDLSTGAVEQKIPLKSSPEYIRAKGDQLLVRTYDTNYVFKAKAAFAPPTPAVLASASGDATPTTSADARCWVRQVTAAILAKDPRALEEASARLRLVSRDRVLDEELRAEVKKLTTVGMLDLAAADVIVVGAPPWQEQRGAAPVPAPKSPRLVKTQTAPASPVRNMNPAFVATEPFFLAPIQRGALPPGARTDIPSSYGMQDLSAIIPDERMREPGAPPKDARSLLVYGGRYVVIVNDATGAERIFDLDALAHPPKANPQWKELATEDATYAQVRDNVLYVCNGGGSYAKEVYGKKGFVSALDATTGALLWRSAPLVCNATFAVAGDYLVTGYGFTAEPDFAFLLRRADGAIVQKVALASGPSSIKRDGAHVHVDTYDSTVDFDLEP